MKVTILLVLGVFSTVSFPALAANTCSTVFDTEITGKAPLKAQLFDKVSADTKQAESLINKYIALFEKTQWSKEDSENIHALEKIIAQGSFKIVYERGMPTASGPQVREATDLLLKIPQLNNSVQENPTAYLAFLSNPNGMGFQSSSVVQYISTRHALISLISAKDSMALKMKTHLKSLGEVLGHQMERTASIDRLLDTPASNLRQLVNLETDTTKEALKELNWTESDFKMLKDASFKLSTATQETYGAIIDAVHTQIKAHPEKFRQVESSGVYSALARTMNLTSDAQSLLTLASELGHFGPKVKLNELSALATLEIHVREGQQPNYRLRSAREDLKQLSPQNK